MKLINRYLDHLISVLFFKDVGSIRKKKAERNKTKIYFKSSMYSDQVATNEQVCSRCVYIYEYVCPARRAVHSLLASDTFL
jgi:hypothetical protein